MIFVGGSWEGYGRLSDLKFSYGSFGWVVDVDSLILCLKMIIIIYIIVL